MKFNICVCGTKNNFIELSEALKTSIEELGHHVDKSLIGKKPAPYKPNEAVIVFMGKPSKIKLDKNSINILLFAEQFHNAKRYKEYCSGYDHVFDIFKPTQEWRNTIFCPLGWSPAFETNIKPTLKHDYFLFGSGNPPYRNQWIRKHEKQITYFRNGCFGEKRNNYIVSSKVNLMIRGRDKYIFTSHRFVLVVSKAKFLACDEHMGYEPYEPGKHFVVFDDLKECEKWLKNDKRRSEFEQAAYEDIKKNHSFTYYLGRALEEAGIK